MTTIELDKIAKILCLLQEGLAVEAKALADELTEGNEPEWSSRMRELATDELTGLADLRQFNLDLEVAVSDSYCGTQSYLILIDCDNLRTVNDSQGHQAGDDLLLKLANVLKKVVRSSDKAYRLHGDEFAILCYTSNCHSFVKRLRIELAGLASIGWASVDEGVYCNADKDLYNQKVWRAK